MANWIEDHRCDDCGTFRVVGSFGDVEKCPNCGAHGFNVKELELVKEISIENGRKLLSPGENKRDWRHVGTLSDGTMVYAAPKCAFSSDKVYKFIPALSMFVYNQGFVSSLRGKAFKLKDADGYSSLHDFHEIPFRYGCFDCGARTEIEAEKKCTGLDACPMTAHDDFSAGIEIEMEHHIAVLDEKTFI